MPLLQKKKNKPLSKQKSKLKFKEELISKFSNSFKKQKRRGCFQLILQGQPYLDTKPDKHGERKENETSVPPVYLEVKILNKILVNQI